ncbi:MAG: HEAT repeat domain-containing protein [Chloroflexi bacterium]|nr:HEAT repeat domain-containing protein [Chloroflexota bacterium]
MDWLQRVYIFISSPGDVSEERERTLRVIERLNRQAHIEDKYNLKPLAYERDVPPDMGEPAQLIIERYIQKPGTCYMVVCILWSRLGTPFVDPRTGERFRSGTEYEFIQAYRAMEKHGKVPHIMVYRCKKAIAKRKGAQIARVNAFFKRFEGKSARYLGFYTTYSTPDEFEEKLGQNINDILYNDPPQATPDTLIDPSVIPKRYAEERHMYSAMPRRVALDQQVSVWAQICIPGSEGFKKDLPDHPKKGHPISKGDVDEGKLSLAFSVDEHGQPLPLRVTLEVKTSDFVPEHTQEMIELHANHDSGKVIFALTPKKPKRDAMVIVTARAPTPDGLMLPLGSAELHTTIAAAAEPGPMEWVTRDTHFRDAPVAAETLTAVTPATPGAVRVYMMRDNRLLPAGGERFDIRRTASQIALGDDHPLEARTEAVGMMLKNSDLTGLRLLLRTMHEGDKQTAQLIREALLRWPKQALALLVQIAIMPRIRQQERAYAGAALRLFGGQAVPPLLQALRQSHNKTQVRHAMKTLTVLGEPAVEPLVKVLRVGDVTMQRRASVALGRIGGVYTIQLVADVAANAPRAHARSTAARTLERIDSSEARAALIKLRRG